MKIGLNLGGDGSLTAASVRTAFDRVGLSHRHEQKQNCDDGGQQRPCTFRDDVTGGDMVSFAPHAVFEHNVPCMRASPRP